MDDTTFPEPSRTALGHKDFGMRKLDHRAARIFTALVTGLAAGDAKKLDNAQGTFMAVSVDFLMHARAGGSWRLYAIAHRYLANGDLVPDPDVEFYVIDQPGHPGVMAVYPLAIDHGPLGYHRYAALESTGEPTVLNRRGAGRARAVLRRLDAEHRFSATTGGRVSMGPHSQRHSSTRSRPAAGSTGTLPTGNT